MGPTSTQPGALWLLPDCWKTWSVLLNMVASTASSKFMVSCSIGWTLVLSLLFKADREDWGVGIFRFDFTVAACGLGATQPAQGRLSLLPTRSTWKADIVF